MYKNKQPDTYKEKIEHQSEGVTGNTKVLQSIEIHSTEL